MWRVKLGIYACWCFNGPGGDVKKQERAFKGNLNKEAGWVKCPPLRPINQAWRTQIQSMKLLFPVSSQQSNFILILFC